MCLRGVMADPITAALVVVSAATGIMSEVEASRFNEKVGLQNQAINAQQTQAEVDRKRRENIKRLGAARAARGASGITIEGSPMEIFSENARNAEMDILNIKYQGALVDRRLANEILLEQDNQKTAISKGVIGGAFKAGKAAGGGGFTPSSGNGGVL